VDITTCDIRHDLFFNRLNNSDNFKTRPGEQAHRWLNDVLFFA